MRQWVRRWEVTIRWERAEDSPKHTTKWETHANTPAQLRRLVEAARADRLVTGYRYKSVNVLEGKPPTHCRRGHGYAGGSFTRVLTDWAACPDCPGHEVYICRWVDDGGRCGDVQVDPPPGPDCDPVRPRRRRSV
jgi:hypothetical protein